MKKKSKNPAGTRNPTLVKHKDAIQTRFSDVTGSELAKYLTWMATYFTILYVMHPESGLGLASANTGPVDNNLETIHNNIEAALQGWCHDMSKKQPVHIAIPVPVYSILHNFLWRDIDIEGHTYRTGFTIPTSWDIRNKTGSPTSATVDVANQLMGPDGFFSRIYGWKHYSARNYMAGERFKPVNFLFGIKDKADGQTRMVVKTYDIHSVNMIKTTGGLNTNYGIGSKTVNQLAASLLSNGPQFAEIPKMQSFSDSVIYVRTNPVTVAEGARRLVDMIVHGGADSILGVVGYNHLVKNNHLAATCTKSIVEAVVTSPATLLPNQMPDIPPPSTFGMIIGMAYMQRDPLLFYAQFAGDNTSPFASMGPGTKYSRVLRTILDSNITTSLIPATVAESVNANYNSLMLQTNAVGVAMPFYQNVTYWRDKEESAGAGSDELSFGDDQFAFYMHGFITSNSDPFKIKFMQKMIAGARDCVKFCELLSGVIRLSPVVSEDQTFMRITAKILVMGGSPGMTGVSESDGNYYLSLDVSGGFTNTGKVLSTEARAKINMIFPAGIRGTTLTEGNDVNISSIASLFGIMIKRVNPNVQKIEVVADDMTQPTPVPNSAPWCVQKYLELHQKSNESDSRLSVQLYTRMPGFVSNTDHAHKLCRIVLWPYAAKDSFNDMGQIKTAVESAEVSGRLLCFGYRTVGVVPSDMTFEVARTSLMSSTGEYSTYYQYLQMLMTMNGGWASKLWGGLKKAGSAVGKFAAKNQDTLMNLGMQGAGLALNAARNSGNSTLSNFAEMIGNVVG